MLEPVDCLNPPLSMITPPIPLLLLDCPVEEGWLFCCLLPRFLRVFLIIVVETIYGLMPPPFTGDPLGCVTLLTIGLKFYSTGLEPAASKLLIPYVLLLSVL